MNPRFQAAMARLPLVAILRGVRPEEAPAILRSLLDAGFTLVETPLNSPDAFASIAAMRALAPPDVVIGAGTVLELADIERVSVAGGDLIVMPHADAILIRAAKARGLIALPGVATPSEAFVAMAAGADGLKAFPAEMITPSILKAWRAVIPKTIPILPVGGIGPAEMAAYVAAGAQGFGLGSALYRPGDSASQVAVKAADFVVAWRKLAP